jgi:hypothetical protein
MFNIKLKEAKNNFGKSTYILIDTITNEEKKCTEEELCDLVVEGDIVGLEKLKDGCVSEILLLIMICKEEEYTITGRVEKDFSSESEIVAYEFEDTFKNKYILRVKETLILVKEYGKMVKNAKINPFQKNLISKDGSDLRKIRKKIVDSKKYLTSMEFDEHSKKCEQLRELYKQGKLIFK